jgi:hypothetical protein
MTGNISLVSMPSPTASPAAAEIPMRLKRSLAKISHTATAPDAHPLHERGVTGFLCAPTDTLVGVNKAPSADITRS